MCELEGPRITGPSTSSSRLTASIARSIADRCQAKGEHRAGVTGGLIVGGTFAGRAIGRKIAKRPTEQPGSQGDLIMKGGYASGRGGPVGQLDLLPRDTKVRPFVNGGYLLADGRWQWMAGGGVDIQLSGKAGLRVAAQDAFARVAILDLDAPSRTATTHEPSFQIGFVYRRNGAGPGGSG